MSSEVCSAKSSLLIYPMILRDPGSLSSEPCKDFGMQSVRYGNCIYVSQDLGQPSSKGAFYELLVGTEYIIKWIECKCERSASPVGTSFCI